MKCIVCNGLVERRPIDFKYANEEERVTCDSCLCAFSNYEYDDNDLDIQNVVYKNGVTPPRFIE